LQNGIASVRAGATLLFDSEPDEEEKETRIKASAFLNAITTKQSVSEISTRHHQVKKGTRVLFVDNQDSFVHTLANYVRQTGVEVITLRMGFAPEKFEEIKPDLVFISPGPRTPEQMNVPEVVHQSIKRDLPVFGVCLGHQGIAMYFGAELEVLSVPVHGKDSMVHHNQEGVFDNIPTPFAAGRYHSLFVKPDGLPDCLQITARTEEGVIMGLAHKELPVASVQFHPESILTLQDDIGLKIISNVIDILT
jgi:anthranilate synthase